MTTAKGSGLPPSRVLGRSCAATESCSRILFPRPLVLIHCVVRIQCIDVKPTMNDPLPRFFGSLQLDVRTENTSVTQTRSVMRSVRVNDIRDRPHKARDRVMLTLSHK